MTRSSLLITALIGLLIWLLFREADTLRAELQRTIERADQAEQLAGDHLTDMEHLAAALASERTAREQLRREQDDLRVALADYRQQLEELKHENHKLRDWAAEFLPAAHRLSEQPAITGTDTFPEHLSGNAALPAAAAEPSARQ